jgi:hypothetical protein
MQEGLQQFLLIYGRGDYCSWSAMSNRHPSPGMRALLRSRDSPVTTIARQSKLVRPTLNTHPQGA